MRSLTVIVASTLLFASLASAGAAQSIPPEGLRAESAGAWDEAAAIYRQTLQREPGRADLWVRVADIEARLGRLPETIAALTKAAQAAPGDASLYRRLSQAYAMSNRPAAATAALESALALDAKNEEYLLAHGTVATWQGDYSAAERSYKKLQALRPDDADVALRLARVSAWAGDTDESVRRYRQYLDAHPSDASVTIELARAESWRGNYGAALDVLNGYRISFGESDAYSRELASVLARAGRPRRAIDIADSLLAQAPSDYALALTRTVGLAMQGRTGDAHEALHAAQRLNPNAAETKTIERLVRTAIGSTVGPGITFYSDSDRLRTTRAAASATVPFDTDTKISAGYERTILQAPSSNGLGKADGRSAHVETIWAGIAQRFGRLIVDGRAGSSDADARTRTPYLVAAHLRAADTLTLSVERAENFFVVSPRTVELGIVERRSRGAIEWDPGVQWHVSAEGSYRWLSDTNQKWELTVTPRRAVARRASFNMDIGASLYALGTTRDLSNGYYDPRRYENYAFVVYPYFKASEDVGVAVTVAAGAQRDEASAPFRFGGTATVDATFGIYRAWALKAAASATNQRRIESGAFEGYSGTLGLTRRF